jgi:hypothetical protein
MFAIARARLVVGFTVPTGRRRAKADPPRLGGYARSDAVWSGEEGRGELPAHCRFMKR